MPRSRASVAQWPPYYEKAPRDKEPVILIPYEDRYALQTVHGRCFPVADHRALVILAVANRWDVYVSDLNDAERGYPWTDEALGDDATEVKVLPDRGIVGLMCHCGVYRLWIGQAKSWGYDEASLEMLVTLVHAFRHLGQGSATTPGALGQAVMRAEHQKERWLKVSRPPRDCRRDLIQFGIGGRVDTPGLGVRKETAYEEDIRNAYAAAARLPLPVGTVSKVPKSVDLTAKEYQYLFSTWYCRCLVYVPTTTKVSPVLYRDGAIVMQANTEGWYGRDGDLPIWLWKHEAEAAKRAGFTVLTRGGWGWEQTAPMLQSWAERMHEARSSAPTSGVKHLIKTSIVAAIGRHGMHPVDYKLVAEEDAGENAIPLLLGGHGPISGLYVQPIPDPDAAALTMWSSFIVSTVRLWIYQRMIEHQEAGNEVLASNYDALIIANPTTLALAPDELGGWRQQALTHVFIEHPRWVESDQKVRRPGLETGLSAVETAIQISERHQIVNHYIGLSPTAQYIRATKGIRAAEEYLKTVKIKETPHV